MAATVFLDTMLFQQYRFPDEIDWPRLVGVPEVELVIAPVVMRQLNRHKDAGTNPRLRERAARTLTRLGVLFDAGPVAQLRPAVTLCYITREPLLDFAAHVLAREVEDDQLVASILAFRQANPGRRVLLATADIGLRLKVADHEIATVLPPPDQKLADQPDPRDQEIRELRREREELLRRIPVLKLGFKGGADHVSFVLPQPFTAVDEWIAPRSAAVRQRHPHMDYPDAAVRRLPGFNLPLAALPRWDEPSDEAIDAYNADLDRFYHRYDHYLAQVIRRENLGRRTLGLDLELRNGGTAPAQDVDVFLRFPTGLQLFDEEGLPDRPTAPEPPDLPRSGYLGLLGSVGSYRPPVFDPSDLGPPKPLQIRRVPDGYEVSFRAGTLKHHLSVPVDRLYVTFDSFDDAFSFRIDYRINAANLPHEERQSLGVVVTKQGEEGTDG